jgi:hypothetical protein
MNIHRTRSLARTSWPVFLLTAALALPMQAQADRGQHRGWDKNEQKHAQKQEEKQQREQAREQQRQRQQVQVQRQQVQVQRRVVVQPQRQVVVRPQQQRVIVQRQQVYVQPQRRVVVRPQVYVRPAAPYYRGGRSNSYYTPDRGYRGSYRQASELFSLDGYLTNEGGACQSMRDDNGHLFALVNDPYGLRSGDHVRLVGRVVDGSYCNWEGTAFVVEDVQALWADRRHRNAYYLEQFDGTSFGSRSHWISRQPRPYDDGYDNYDDYDNYDPYRDDQP